MIKRFSILVDICDQDDPEALLTGILADAFDKLGLAAIVVAVDDSEQLDRLERESHINEIEMWGPEGRPALATFAS